MRAVVVKWGNGLALHLPKAATEALRLAPGTPVDLRLEGLRLTLTPRRPRYQLAALLERMTPARRHGEGDWGAPRGAEIW